MPNFLNYLYFYLQTICTPRRPRVLCTLGLRGLESEGEGVS